MLQLQFYLGRQSIFSYNKVTNTGLLQSDGAVFQGTKNYVEGSVVHHNFVYDTEKYAFRYDAPGGDASELEVMELCIIISLIIRMV